MSSTVISINSTALDINGSNSSTVHSYTGSTATFYVSVFFIWFPGTVSNILALGFIIYDMKKAIFPVIVLLFNLCCCDLFAVLSSWSYHILLRYVQITYPVCSVVAFTFTFFNISASVTNAVMAADRVLAICYPFYYKKHIDANTWKKVCAVGAVLIACYSAFPLAGLGKVMTERGRSYMCDSFSYRTVPIQRIFGIVFGLIGVACVMTILICNCLLLKTLLTLNKSVACVESSSSTVENTTVTRPVSFEIAFAKLMVCLAAVYLFCGAPMQIMVLLQAVGVPFTPATVGYIHLLAGFVYTVDPMIYILIRKVKFKRLARCLCLCKQGTSTAA